VGIVALVARVEPGCGGRARELVDALVDDPAQWPVIEALEAWRPLIEGRPRIARAVYVWDRAADRP